MYVGLHLLETELAEPYVGLNLLETELAEPYVGLHLLETEIAEPYVGLHLLETELAEPRFKTILFYISFYLYGASCSPFFTNNIRVC